MRAIVLFFLISGMLSACGGNNNQGNATKNKLKVVSTIKPVHSIVQAIAGEQAETTLLIPAYASPHHYSFKPSDVRELNDADVIFRIDEHLEAMLTPLIPNLSEGTSVVSLAEISDLNLLEVRHRPQSKSYEHNAKENTDFHIWTSPKNAQLIAKKIAEVLSQHNPEQAAFYKQNYQNFKEALDSAVTAITEKLQDNKTRSYIVFHNSWQYFADFFGLQQAIVIQNQKGIKSGAKTISAMKAILQQGNVDCVFYDSTVSEAQREVLLANSLIKTGEIDVLMKYIHNSKPSYIDWLKQFAEGIRQCLSP